jgi:hypothetical protein
MPGPDIMPGPYPAHTPIWALVGTAVMSVIAAAAIASREPERILFGMLILPVDDLKAWAICGKQPGAH